MSQKSRAKWHDFTPDIDLDIPIWRFLFLAVFLGSAALGAVALSRGGIDEVPSGWWVITALIMATCLVPPLVWRWTRRTLPVTVSFITLFVLIFVGLLFF